MRSGKESEGGNNGGSNEIGVHKDNTEEVPYQPLNLSLTKTPELINLIASALDQQDLHHVSENLRTLIPPKKTNQEVSTLKPPIGFAMALACTPLGGGSTPYIVTTIVEEEQGKGSLQIMGQLGNVLKQSAEIAYRVAGRIMLKKEPENPFFRNFKLHLRVSGGDGPSAGCTMITSLLSLAMKKPVRKNLAMTGAVTITGTILPISGVREKTIAARRSLVKMIIFPKDNRREFDELEENVKEGLDAHFVNDYNQIFELAFGYDH